MKKFFSDNHANITEQDFFNKAILMFCRLGFAGLSPKAPGTCGTAVACVLAPFIYLPLNFFWRFLLLVGILLLGGLASGRAEKILRKKDPGQVVIDELLGVWLCMLPFSKMNFWNILFAFIFFRIFDIAKPWPVKASEKWLPGGFGIMIDDVLAGIYAMICLLILNRLSVI